MSQLTTTTGEVSPFVTPPNSVLPADFFDRIREKVERGEKAKPAEFTDKTPIYWQARAEEKKVLVFLGFKITRKINQKTGEESPKMVAVLHDGNREVVMAQIAAIDALKTAVQGQTYKITCLQDVAEKAKKFEVLLLND